MEPLLRNLRLPVIGAPMFLVSGPDLVTEQCRAGITGAFPALNARSSSELCEWIGRIKDSTADQGAAPFAVNLIVHQRNARLDDDLDACIAGRVPLIITSMSSPERVVERVHGYGGLVFHDASTVKFARKAASAGVDGLVLVCAGAGGHTGSLSPFAFVAEVKRFFSGPLVLAGSITTGAGVLAARAMGCDYAYMGTRFIATRESLAPAAYKSMVVSSTVEDIVSTPFFSGVTANYLAPSIRAAGLDPQNLPLEQKPAGYQRRADGPKAWKDVWGAGQGVGAVTDIPSTRELVERLEAEYREAQKACLPAG
jgi:nitronate monooxygenase